MEVLIKNLEIELQESNKRCDQLIKRWGENHVKRDWSQNLKYFPDGHDIKNLFLSSFINLESFFYDAIFCMDSSLDSILLQIYEICNSKINSILENKKQIILNEFGANLDKEDFNDGIIKLFWYSTMQKLVPSIMKNINIKELINGNILLLSENMKKNSEIDKEGINIEFIFQKLLLLFLYCKLSDPECYIKPKPKTRVLFKEELYREVLGPSTKIHGRIKEGEEVEIFFPGLFFDGSDRPIILPLVRRLN